MCKQMLFLRSLWVVAMLSALALSAWPVQASELKGVAGIGLDFGGDTLATAVYRNGTSSDVKADEGMVFNAGGVMIIDQYETQLTIGYKFGGPIARNGSVTWNTVPVELIQFLRANNVRIGLGFCYQLNPKLVVDTPGSSYTNEYDNALGTIAQIGWAPVDMPFSIDLRYTSIKYKQNNVGNAEEISGNVVGVYSSIFF